MSDPGLGEAVRAAGGVTELAWRIGASQPSVSNWSRVPAERVLSVEAAPGVARAILRPDLHGESRQRRRSKIVGGGARRDRRQDGCPDRYQGRLGGLERQPLSAKPPGRGAGKAEPRDLLDHHKTFTV